MPYIYGGYSLLLPANDTSRQHNSGSEKVDRINSMYAKVQERASQEEEHDPAEEKTYDTQMAYYQAYGKGIYGKLHTLEDDNASSTSSSEVKLLPTDGSVITKKPQLMKRHSSKNVTKIPSNSSSRLKESSGRPHSTSELDFGHMIPESLIEQNETEKRHQGAHQQHSSSSSSLGTSSSKK